MPRPTNPSVNEETLKKLQELGHAHPLIAARLQYVEATHLISHYLRAMVGVERVYPRMLPTQTTGRWSTTEPPLVNFTADKRYGPEGIRDVVCPDPGFKFIGFDYEAIEGRLTAYDCKDQEDIEAFERGWEIHTLTACKMFHWPEFKGNPTKKELFSDQEYCAELGFLAHRMLCREKSHGACPPELWHDDHRLRRLAKNCRYSLIYELVRSKGAAMRRYAFEMRMDPGELQHIGELYLASKPGFVQWKGKWQTQCAATGLARTLIYGRRRLLCGDRDTRAKEGPNHRIQGSVADIICTGLVAVDQDPILKDLTLAYQSHDGAKWHCPESFDPLPHLKTHMEQTWTIGGRACRFPAAWKVTPAPKE